MIVALSAALLFGFTLGGVVGYQLPAEPTSNDSHLRLSSSEYKFINPLLDFQEQQTPLMRRELRLLEEAISARIETATVQKKVTTASVYYRDLNNGPWLYVNEQEFYTPASLLKVPLMITYFKLAERNPDILNQTIIYATSSLETVPVDTFDSLKSQLVIGNSYTVDELLFRMITESDNTATLLLNQYVDVDEQKRVYKDFDVPLPSRADEPRTPFITAQGYASFLRILYNGTYLSRAYSERALEMLSQSTFNDGLRAGAPPGAKISNKYGVYLDSTNKESGHQLHDCGIFYAKKTFVLCIMTSGNDFAALTNLISDIAHIVYRENVI